MKINGYDYREDRFYTKKHLWVQRIEKNKARIGLDSFFVERLGPISDIELTYLDNDCELNDSIATLYFDSESKDLLAPVSGRICNVNEEVEEDPMILLEDPYEKGWLVEIILLPGQDLSRLMRNDEAESWFQSETEKEPL